MANRAGLILTLARQLGIRDPRAVLSVAAQEGLGGGIGDNGTSFGPFQLHQGGAFPRGIQGNKQNWAWSRPGLLYALSQIKGVAGNLRGQAAISNIVRRFERPANAQAEIANALKYYGGSSGAPSGMPVLPAGAGTPTPTGNPIRQAILAALAQGTFSPDTILQARMQMGSQMPPGSPVSPAQPLKVPRKGFTPTELFYDPLGGIKNGKQIGAIGGHSDHVHVAYTNPQAMLQAIALATKLGLHVGQNPYEGGVDPVHVKNSYHYRDFPGKYHGRMLGEAIDVSGPKKRMAQYYRLLAAGK